jgi:hypothetical protein
LRKAKLVFLFLLFEKDRKMKVKKIIFFCLMLLLILGCVTSCTDETEDLTVQWQDLIWAVGAPLPTAEDFVLSLPEGVEVAFAEEYQFSHLGDYTLELTVMGTSKKSQRGSVKLTLISDAQPPVMEGIGDIVSYVGEGISYRAGVTVRDNCNGKLRLEVDSSAVNIHAAGVYPVTYTATDFVGNVATETVNVYIYDSVITEEMLNEELDRVIAQRIPTSASKEVQIREVYDYVYYHVKYTGSSDKSDWIRAAYEGLRSGTGDCYTYFALSKAFFNRLGIENMDIQRTEGIVDERHYWNLVNIGETGDSARWYHFDATPLQGGTHSGCLLTDRQVAYYNATRENEDGVSGYFYAYDPSGYPSSDKTVINHSLPEIG